MAGSTWGRTRRVVVVGGGMAGLEAARKLVRSGAAVTLVDAHNYTTFPPMLFYVAAAFLSPEDVVRPVRALLPKGSSIDFKVGTVATIDQSARHVALDDGRALPYDYLVLAPGVVPAFGSVAGAAAHAIPLKSATDAARLRNALIRVFESAAAHPTSADVAATSVVIIGGGPTGVEVAGYLTDFLFRYSFPHDYPEVPRERMRVTLIEAGNRLLPDLHPTLSRYALKRLRRHGVDIRLETKVVAVDSAGVTLEHGERLAAATAVWGGGVGVAPWIGQLGLPIERGRIIVGPDLRVAGHEEIFAIGDAAAIRSPGGVVYGQLAQVALQSGRHAARQIRLLMAGRLTTPFMYHDKGMMAMVGRNAAIIQTGPVRLTGFLAWVAWGILHLAYLPGVVNRLAAFQKFMLWHITHDSNARILFEPPGRPTDTDPTSTIDLDGTVQRLPPTDRASGAMGGDGGRPGSGIAGRGARRADRAR